tara:strand:+ start:431 stop:691 length:261 start_codon:yes stop_codon:yes gene_type:complete
MKCFYTIADTNNDNLITPKELSRAIDKALHWYEKIPFKLFGGIATIMKDCDANHDKILSVDESMQMDTCMDTCFKRKHTSEHFNCA